MTTIDFSLDSRVKKTYVPLVSQQRHLRHLKRVAARNITLSSDQSKGISGDQSIGYCFTIHDMSEDLLYKSETIFSTTPEWKAFQSSSFRCPAKRQFIIRLYYCQTISSDLSETNASVSEDNGLSFEPFLEWEIHLNGLVFIGEEIPKDNRFKENVLILGLMEGFYTSYDFIANEDFRSQLCLPRPTIPVPDITSLRNSYCLNVLYRIEMMQRVINQTLVSVNNSRTKLEEKLSKMLDKSELKSRVELMEVRVKGLQKQLRASKERLNTCREIKITNESDICEKDIDMLNKILDLKQQKEKLIVKKDRLSQTRERLTKTKALLMIRRKQLLTDISNIYPLVPFPDGNGGYSICGVHLPNSEHFEGHDQKMISIAIGYVTHILVMISRLLDVSLRYQIIYFGSNSSVVDHMNDKISENDRIFPLFSKGGKDRLHFRYGVFLINKNIAQLRHYLGLPTRDLSATLPNLYSLLKDRLVFLNDDTMVSIQTHSTNGMATNSTESPNTSHFGQIDEFLRREIEVMRNQPELQEAGPSKGNAIRLRNLSIVSNNSVSNRFRTQSENRNISRSLDKGLNETLNELKQSNIKSTDGSVSSSVSSENHFHLIPKHLLNSNQIHHNLSETDFKRLIERKKPKHSDNNELFETNDNQLINGVNGNRTDGSDASPQSHVLTDNDIEYNIGNHCPNN